MSLWSSSLSGRAGRHASEGTRTHTLTLESRYLSTQTKTWRPQPDLWFCSSTARFLPLLPLPLFVSPPSTVTHSIQRTQRRDTAPVPSWQPAGSTLSNVFRAVLSKKNGRKGKRKRKKSANEFPRKIQCERNSGLQNQVTGNPQNYV